MPLALHFLIVTLWVHFSNEFECKPQSIRCHEMGDFGSSTSDLDAANIFPIGIKDKAAGLETFINVIFDKLLSWIRQGYMWLCGRFFLLKRPPKTPFLSFFSFVTPLTDSSDSPDDLMITIIYYYLRIFKYLAQYRDLDSLDFNPRPRWDNGGLAASIHSSIHIWIVRQGFTNWQPYCVSSMEMKLGALRTILTILATSDCFQIWKKLFLRSFPKIVEVILSYELHSHKACTIRQQDLQFEVVDITSCERSYR